MLIRKMSEVLSRGADSKGMIGGNLRTLSIGQIVILTHFRWKLIIFVSFRRKGRHLYMFSTKSCNFNNISTKMYPYCHFFCKQTFILTHFRRKARYTDKFFSTKMSPFAHVFNWNMLCWWSFTKTYLFRHYSGIQIVSYFLKRWTPTITIIIATL